MVELDLLIANSTGEEIKKTCQVIIDVTLQAHLIWDENFKKDMNCSLMDFTARLAKAGNAPEWITSNLVSVLKWTFCHIKIVGYENIDFGQFMSMITYSEIEPLTNGVVNKILKSSENSASKN